MNNTGANWMYYTTTSSTNTDWGPWQKQQKYQKGGGYAAGADGRPLTPLEKLDAAVERVCRLAR